MKKDSEQNELPPDDAQQQVSPEIWQQIAAGNPDAIRLFEETIDRSLGLPLGTMASSGHAPHKDEGD